MRTTSTEQDILLRAEVGFIVSGCGFIGRTKNNEFKKLETYIL